LLVDNLADPERNGLSDFFVETLIEMAERLRFLDERVSAYDLKIKRLFQQDERCQRLAKIEGVGTLVATALVAAVGNACEFKSGRELSAWLAGTASALKRQSERAARHQQARRSLLAHTADSRCARRFAHRRPRKDSAQRMAKSTQT
jgi:transposase